MEVVTAIFQLNYCRALPHAEAIALLSSEELARAERLKIASLRHHYIAAHSQLRIFLAKHLLSPSCHSDDTNKSPTLRIAKHSGGKPYLADFPDQHFNLSHSGPYACAALSRCRLGVDIEYFGEATPRDWKKNLQPLAKRYFTSSEITHLEQLSNKSAQAALEEFYQIWTRKEAILKNLGTGLRTPLNSFNVPLGPLPIIGCQLTGSPQWCEGLWLYNLPVPQGCTACLCTNQPINHFQPDNAPNYIKP